MIITRKTILALIAFVGLGIQGALALAGTFTEKRIECDERFEVRWESTEGPKSVGIYVQCVTFGDNGQVIRPVREYNIANRLTQQQRTTLGALLDRIPTDAAQNETIPTPTAKPSP